ncbi:MAG: phosphotransferase [Pseudomonadales bacterium]
MSNGDITFPTRPEELSLDYLTECLRSEHILSDESVAASDYKLIGTGKMGDNARIALSYDRNVPSAPETIIAKFPAADEHARAMAGAQGAYYNEVMFYRDLAPNTAMRTPTIFASELSEDKTGFLLLMEDMAPAEPGSQLIGESLGHCQMAIKEAAKLAAAFYGREDLSSKDYIMSGARDDGAAFGQELMIQYWPVFVERFGHGLSQQQLDFGEHYSSHHAHFATRFAGPKTIAHGDFRSENILFGADTITVVDWQTVSESSAVTDVAYFLGGSVDTENRRAWEQQLVKEYRLELDRNGVSLSDTECWDLYREYSMHGLMITVLGACFSSPGERSDKMFLAMIQRHLQHCIDVGANEFLPAT